MCGWGPDTPWSPGDPEAVTGDRGCVALRREVLQGYRDLADEMIRIARQMMNTLPASNANTHRHRGGPGA